VISVWWYLMPLVAAGLALSVLVAAQCRMAPRSAALAAGAGSLAIGTVGFTAAALISAASWMHAPFVERALGWASMGHEVGPPGWLGAAATGVVSVGAVRLASLGVRTRQLRRRVGELIAIATQSTLIDESAHVFAYSLPGPRKLTVVSRGLLEVLEPAEQEIVLAHETAHHVHRHDRILLAGHIGEALFVPVRALRRGLEHALERWADEHAATAVGSRRAVGVTVAKVALLSANDSRKPPFGALGFLAVTPFGTVRRVECLSRPARSTPLWAYVLGASAGASLLAQIHHFDRLIGVLCRL
jgi:Zn-dependent protease with chaperone function